MFRGWPWKIPFFLLSTGEYGLVAWVGQSSPFHVQGWGAAKSVLGWWAGNGITACQIFKLFFIYIYI